MLLWSILLNFNASYRANIHSSWCQQRHRTRHPGIGLKDMFHVYIIGWRKPIVQCCRFRCSHLDVILIVNISLHTFFIWMAAYLIDEIQFHTILQLYNLIYNIVQPNPIERWHLDVSESRVCIITIYESLQMWQNIMYIIYVYIILVWFFYYHLICPSTSSLQNMESVLY